MNITVAFTVSGMRQKYLRSTLDSWAQVRGVQDVEMLFCVEPGGNFPVGEFSQWAAATFARTGVRVNASRKGCLKNTGDAMALAFSLGADFAILCEEDIHVSADVLEYFRWAAETYQGNDQVKAICAHSFNCAPQAGKDQVCSIDWFSPLVWGTWKDRWEEFIAPRWSGCLGNPDAWDTNLRLQIKDVDGRAIFPCRSRSLHVGEISTLMQVDLAQHFYKGSVSANFSPDHGVQEYREVPRSPELALIV